MDRRTLLALATATLGAVLLVLAASSGPVRVWSEPPSRPATDRPVTIDTEVTDETPALGTVPPPTADTTESPFWRIIAAVGFVLLVWLAVVVISTWVRMLGRAEWWRRGHEPGFEPLPQVADPVVALDVEAARSALAAGTPRNAIVACWLQLERDAAAAGLPRHPAETSVEYTSRVVGASSVDRGPIDELGALYREARFSRHDLDDGHRRRAIEALARVAAALPAPEVPEVVG
jgi:hypothetical protein